MIRPYQSGLLGHDLKPRDIFWIFSGLSNLCDYILYLLFPPVVTILPHLGPDTDQCIMGGHAATSDCNWPLSHIGGESGDQTDDAELML